MLFKFIISVANQSAIKPSNLKIKTPIFHNDPLDTKEIDSTLVVSPINPAHTLVLNKFYSVTGHVS